MTKQSDKKFYVYLMMSSNNRVIYIGVTNSLIRRVYEHRNKLTKGFTNKYNVNKLVYFEQYDYAYEAISREKQLKAGSRKKKFELIKKDNQDFIDLYDQVIE